MTKIEIDIDEKFLILESIVENIKTLDSLEIYEIDEERIKFIRLKKHYLHNLYTKLTRLSKWVIQKLKPY